MNKSKTCYTCKWRKQNKTCKNSPREKTGDYDWCSAYRKKAGVK